MHDLKEAACGAIDAASATLFDISAKMHAETELSFEEVKAQAWQCAALRAAGFAVEEGLGSLKTAFRATVASSKPGPRIAFLCEYDGLPVYRQSCGHNVVAAAGVGAAIGLAKVIGRSVARPSRSARRARRAAAARTSCTAKVSSRASMR